MGVDRTDYLFWGVMIDPGKVDRDALEDEIDGAPGAKFDLVLDGMGGQYAVAGKIVAQSDPYEGIEFVDVGPRLDLLDKAGVFGAVGKHFPDKSFSDFGLLLFSHFH